MQRLDDLDRDQLLYLVRVMRRDAATHEIVEPTPAEIGEAIVMQAVEAETQARATYDAAAATAIVDAQAVTRHVEIHGYAAPYRARFEQAMRSQKTSRKARQALAQATAARLKAEAALRRLTQETAA